MITSNPIASETETTALIIGLQKLPQANDMGRAVIIQKADLFYSTGPTQTGWLYEPVYGEPLCMAILSDSHSVKILNHQTSP